MANYSLTTSTVEDKSYTAVVAALEAVLEAVDNAKAIRHYSIVYNSGANRFVGTVVHDT